MTIIRDIVDVLGLYKLISVCMYHLLITRIVELCV